MHRKFISKKSLSLFLAVSTIVTVLPVAGTLSAAETIRIETRPFYGATITIEEGVRVFRALPADRRVIINPQGTTPLSLNFDESTNVTRRADRNDDDQRDSLTERLDD